MANLCELWVGGQRYSGWKSIEIQRGIEQCTGQFSLSVTERWPGSLDPRPIAAGQPCRVTIDGDPVITGYVDEARPGYDDKTTWFNVTGRDKTADLVDCSAIYKTGQWKGQTLARIARDLTAPFGIEVVIGPMAAAANAPIPSFNIEEGESVFDCLERAARLKALMLWTDGLGKLVIDLPGSQRTGTALVEGKNILRAEGMFNWAERYSEYIVKGQAPGQHDARGTARDSTVNRYRPLIVLAEDAAPGVTPQQRAEWEKQVRAGRANRISVKVQSWRQAGDDGELWAPGLLVLFDSPRLRINAELVIAQVQYTLDENGSVALLELADPRAFLPLARGKKVRSGRKRHHKPNDDDLSKL